MSGTLRRDAAISQNSALGLPVPGKVNPGSWFKVPNLFRLRLVGTGTLTVDAMDHLGTVATAVYTATANGATNQIEYPYIGDAADQIRVSVTGSLTVEVM